jgi:hypothetical protein
VNKLTRHEPDVTTWLVCVTRSALLSDVVQETKDRTSTSKGNKMTFFIIGNF